MSACAGQRRTGMDIGAKVTAGGDGRIAVRQLWVAVQ